MLSTAQDRGVHTAFILQYTVECLYTHLAPPISLFSSTLNHTYIKATADLLEETSDISLQLHLSGFVRLKYRNSLVLFSAWCQLCLQIGQLTSKNCMHKILAFHLLGKFIMQCNARAFYFEFLFFQRRGHCLCMVCFTFSCLCMANKTIFMLINFLFAVHLCKYWR